MLASSDETQPLIPGQDGTSSYQSLDTPKQITTSVHSREDDQSDIEEQPELAQVPSSVRGIITVLLLGEFISNADGTLIMAAAGRVSSEFNQLQAAGWLSTAYTLGLCAAQPMYGRLSDLYGRKALLLASYFLLGLGCIICGVGNYMWIVILGRVVSGIGGAGVMAMSSIIITDIVPKREVARWRAYVNVSMTLGRSIGGPVGGVLTDTIGWRWAFLLQAPVLGLAALLVIIQLRLTPIPPSPSSTTAIPGKSGLRRIDWPGLISLATGITTLVLLFDQGGKSFAWASLSALVLLSLSALSLATFVYIEYRVAAEPIFDLRILTRPNVATSYMITSLQIAAQVGMMFSVPLYFQVSGRVSSTVAGAHLVPAVIGNTVGGLVAGNFIRRTGRYKSILVTAGLIASIAYVLQLVRWNGHTGIWESLYIGPGGLGTGFASSASFISMTALLEPREVGMATGGYLLCLSFAMTAGVTATNTVLGSEFKRQLENQVHGPGASEIIKRALSSTEYIISLPEPVYAKVVQCYVAGLKHTYIVSLVASLLGSVIALTVRNHHI